MKRTRTYTAIAIGLLFVTGVATQATALQNPLRWFGIGKSEPTPAAPPPTVAPTPAAGPPLSFADIARNARPAVVNVSTTQTVHTRGLPQLEPFGENDPFNQFFRRFFGPMPRDFTQRALGSAVVIDRNGDIVTNAHVVKDADKIVIKFDDQRQLDAKVVGIDEKTDIALLKVDPPANLTIATLGNSDTLRVGDWVIAIGNPFGLSQTVTAGIVSAKGRVIGAGPYDDFIQTDASINPGNSGGPLLDLRGEVVGINSAIFSQSGGNIGIGFAIPINLVKNVVDQLKAHGKVVRAWLGVSIQGITPDLAESLNLAKPEGALVADVTADSPAAHAGFKRGDVITDFNGTHVDQAHQLPALVASIPVGTKVSVTVLRDGQEKTFDVALAELPASARSAPARSAAADWGLEVSNITPEAAQQFNLAGAEGVVVTGVAPGSAADDAGLQPGDVISQLNRQAIHNVDDYRRALTSASDKKNLLLLVERDRQSSFIVLHRSE